ncbi:MAG TPA: hypothetical protein VKQ30_20705 [Ktedonobacterales bacterium]|nr:hypothetical protein [Ktedonobacterales bacterium]
MASEVRYHDDDAGRTVVQAHELSDRLEYNTYWHVVCPICGAGKEADKVGYRFYCNYDAMTGRGRYHTERVALAMLLPDKVIALDAY